MSSLGIETISFGLQYSLYKIVDRKRTRKKKKKEREQDLEPERPEFKYLFFNLLDCHCDLGHFLLSESVFPTVKWDNQLYFTGSPHKMTGVFQESNIYSFFQHIIYKGLYTF